MEKLDRLVTERLVDKLLTPERIVKLLRGLLERQSLRDEDHTVRLTALRKKLLARQKRELHQLFRHIDDPVVICRRFHPAALVELLIGFCDRGLVRDRDHAHPAPQDALPNVKRYGGNPSSMVRAACISAIAKPSVNRS